VARIGYFNVGALLLMHSQESSSFKRHARQIDRGLASTVLKTLTDTLASYYSRQLVSASESDFTAEGVHARSSELALHPFD
jgi:hypothetical protein